MDLVSLVTAIIGGVVGGGLAYFGAIHAVKTRQADLEADEIRRQKVDCLASLGGLRFVMSPSPAIPMQQRAQLAYQLNKAMILWCNDDEVIKDLRDFWDNRSNKGIDPNQRFVSLFRNLAKTTELPVDKLSDADITRIFSMSQLDNPAQ